MFDVKPLSSAPKGAYIEPFEAKSQPTAPWISLAHEIALNICQHTFEQQNEMLLKIQAVMISDRTILLEQLQQRAFELTKEIESTKAALESISK